MPPQQLPPPAVPDSLSAPPASGTGAVTTSGALSSFADGDAEDDWWLGCESAHPLTWLPQRSSSVSA